MQLYFVTVDEAGMAADMAIFTAYPGKSMKLNPHCYLVEEPGTFAPHYVSDRIGIGKPGGILGLVMAVSHFHGHTTAPLRDWLLKHGYGDRAAEGYAERTNPDLMLIHQAMEENGKLIDLLPNRDDDER